jgi:ATP-dependent Clp protease ATP-binding subunit ClpC
MLRSEPGVVLKYFDALDQFVKIRRFTPEGASQLLCRSRVTDRRSYLALVVNACVVDLPTGCVGREEALYEICVEVNPDLEIHKAVIASAEEPGRLHLLPPSAPPPARDFRRLADMEEALGRRIVGQEAAVAAVTRAVRKSMTGLRDPRRPVATFFFVGQTGVGKTELAKALTLYLFQDPARMLRVDCSEYALPHEVAKLTGAPPGYVGHDRPGLLAQLSAAGGPLVVLLDEIEKSDGKIRDLMLQAMDEGFVTDNHGARVSFSDAILIFTSNVGSEEAEALRHRIGFAKGVPAAGEFAAEFERAFKAGFRPEFVNRITETVFFNPIGLAECERIARLFLEEVREHAERVPLTLRFEERVPRFLAEKSFKPEYGARELRRTVERDVEGALSDLLVEGRLAEGDAVTVRVSRDRLRFHRN